MWELRRLTTLWASTVSYRDSFTVLYLYINTLCGKENYFFIYKKLENREALSFKRSIKVDTKTVDEINGRSCMTHLLTRLVWGNQCYAGKSKDFWFVEENNILLIHQIYLKLHENKNIPEPKNIHHLPLSLYFMDRKYS
jgi:hypothetical protein